MPLKPDNERPAPPPVEAHEWQRAYAALDLARALVQPLWLSEALATLGRCARRSGEAVEAGRCFDEALAWARLLPATDPLADLLCERGELAADHALDPAAPDQIGDIDAWLLARACAAEAGALAARASDPTWEVRVLLRASDLFNRLGGSVEAVALQVRAMQRMNPPRGEADAAPPAAIELQGHATLQ